MRLDHHSPAITATAHDLVREVFPAPCTLCGNDAPGGLCRRCDLALRREAAVRVPRVHESALAKLSSIPPRRAPRIEPSRASGANRPRGLDCEGGR